MEQLENVIKEHLINEALSDIEFYNVGAHYFSPDPDHTWVINGGIEMKIGDKHFSFGWCEEKEFFDVLPGPINELTGELNIENLEAKNVEGIKALVGRTIVDIKFKWNFYHEYDENFELKEEKKHMPFELMLLFDDQITTLQLSTIGYGIQNNEIVDLEYDSQKGFLISLNRNYEIMIPANE